MSQLPVPREGNGGQVVLPAEVIRENIRSVISKMPDLISFDPSDSAAEGLMLRCAVDPGIEAQKRDGWTATVNQWSVQAYDVEDEKSGEVVTLPSLCLIAEDGTLCRLTGWPAIKSWANLLRAAGAERCSLGVRIVVRRRPSGTAGRSYWLVLPA